MRQRSDSIPRLLEPHTGNSPAPTPHIQDTQEYAPPTAPSHKRKQSDIPTDLPISPSAFRSSLDLEIYNEEDDDSIVYSGPVDDNNNYTFIDKVRNVKIRWLGIGFVILLSLLGTRRKSSRATPIPSSEELEGYESVGDPIEAHVKYNSIEYYADLNRVGNMISIGPTNYGESHAGGLYNYENVCVTNNVDYPKKPFQDTSMRGLVRFTNDKQMLKNKKRCVPCTVEETIELQSNSGTSTTVGHSCGMKGLHEMYASSVIDWNECINDKENRGLMIRSRQSQTPSHVTNVHFFERPTYLLQFTANDRESSLFDTLFSYLPHWHQYRSNDKFPFDGVLSHSVEGCLSHSRNWLCELLHHMSAFGSAKEILWEQSPDTLYCFRSLQVNRLGYQRSLNGGQITKGMMDELRDVLFRSMALPRPRDMQEIRQKDAKLGMTRSFKIAMYANLNHGLNVWNNMHELVAKAKGMTKYHGVEFSVVEDFNELTVAEQARAFNLADAVIMSTGEHMANAIFVTDDTMFVELGCGGFSSIDNAHFMSFVLGTHQSVKGCDGANEEVCVQCSREGLNSSFIIAEDAFHSLVDGILKAHQEKVAIMRDSRRELGT